MTITHDGDLTCIFSSVGNNVMMMVMIVATKIISK